jgi:ATP-dependent DNA ligase
MTLPLKPPVKPQLAKSARALPEGDQWCYEPKFDGFRTIVFRDGDDVHLQSRNGRPMNRYFPDVVEQALAQLGRDDQLGHVAADRLLRRSLHLPNPDHH